MAVVRSFTEYIKNRFDNTFWEVAENYLESNFDSLEIELKKVHRAGEHEITDVNVEHVWVEDKPEMEIHFDVAVSISFVLHEGDYHYDDYDENIVWMMLNCRGDLDRNLDDFEILQVSSYSGKNRRKNPMDDSLVPIITVEELEDTAIDFLKNHYPEALRIPKQGQDAIWVDPKVLSREMGLTVKTQRISKDASVFGQIYFYDTETKMYDSKSDTDVSTYIEGKTIVVDPQMYLLRNLGSVNNTIIHECVHWYKHRKAFKLEKLFNDDASYISCEVVGDADSRISSLSIKHMEQQANQLTPRIQMPKEPFVVRAKDYISYFMRETNSKHTIDIMEMVIRALERDYGVSKLAVKIRLVELGFEEAIGTFNYVDGHYVKPHGFRKGAINNNQTFTLSAQDAAIQRLTSKELREKTENGDYLFVDNHYVYNAPLYVDYNEKGKLELTDYARAHMDECCLVFDMRITSKVESIYHTACFLNREPSDITFEITYHNGFQYMTKASQVEFRQKQMEEWMEIRKQMTDDPEQCMDLLLKWRGLTYTDLGDAIDRDPKTISRTVKRKTKPSIETAVLICFGMNLPPVISEKLLDVLDCRLNPMDSTHQWLNEALHVKYPEPLWTVREYLSQYNVDI